MTSPRDLDGTILKDTYRLKKVIGRGGMAEVYAATHVHLPRRYAIKLFSPSLASSPMLMKRFQREATVTCRLDHPNIVEVSDFGNDRKLGPYIVMELLVGENLSRRLARVKTLPLDEACAVVEQVCSALTVAHAEGVVHRDLKPGNIFICRKTAGGPEVIKLLDFGISQVPDSALTQTNARLGSARYMSPEQAQAKQMDHRTDIFSMGSIVFSMLAGRPPYSGKDELVVMYQIVHEEPRKLGSFRPDLSLEVERVVDKALKKDPDERYQSVNDLSAAFAREVAKAAAHPSSALEEASTDPAPAPAAPPDDEPTSEVDASTEVTVAQPHAGKRGSHAVLEIDPHKKTLMEPVAAAEVDAHKETLMGPIAAPLVDAHQKTLMGDDALVPVNSNMETLKAKAAIIPANHRMETLRDKSGLALVDSSKRTVKEHAVVVPLDPGEKADDVPELVADLEPAQPPTGQTFTPAGPLDPVESTQQLGRRSLALPVAIVVLLLAAATTVVFFITIRRSTLPVAEAKHSASPDSAAGAATPVVTGLKEKTPPPPPGPATSAAPPVEVPAKAAPRRAKKPSKPPPVAAAPFQGDLVQVPKKPPRRRRPHKKRAPVPSNTSPRAAPFSDDL